MPALAKDRKTFKNGSSATSTVAPLTASSETLKLSGLASCIKINEVDRPLFRCNRKYRRFEASPVNNTMLTSSAEGSSRVRKVVAINIGSGGAEAEIAEGFIALKQYGSNCLLNGLIFTSLIA